MPIVTGHDARARITFAGAGAMTMHAVRYSVMWRVDALDETSFINANFGQYNFGVMDFEISMDLLYDTLSDPFAVTGLGGIDTAQNVFALALQPGTFIGVTLDVTEANATRVWTFPVVMVTDVRMDDAVRDLVRYSVTGRGSHDAADVGGPAATPVGVTATSPVA